MYIAAVPAFPLHFLFALEHSVVFDVLRQFEITGFVALFHFRDFFKNGGDVREAFGGGDFTPVQVQVGPLFVFTRGSCQQFSYVVRSSSGNVPVISTVAGSVSTPEIIAR